MALSLLLILAFAAQKGELSPARLEVSQTQVPLPQVIPGTWSAWMKHLQPTEEESAFQGIDWRPTFAQGVLDANQARLPLLLWVMNGHPLGCT